MKREPDRLGEGPFDLLVVGGGVYGTWIAYDAALRGLSVALVEAEDWGAGTSSASSKLVHGGLRYLEQFHFGLVRTSLAERGRLWELGPHRVWPRRFVIPVYRGDRVGPFKFRVGLSLYDFIAGKLAPGLDHTRLSPARAREAFPFLREEGLRAAFEYTDAQTDDARLCLEIVAGALQAGAVAVNHMRAVEPILHSGKLAGVTVRDDQAGSDGGGTTVREVRARAVVDATGAFSDTWLPLPDTRPTVRRTKGVHLMMPPLPTERAFLLPTGDKRIIFVVPWYGATMLGTTDTDHQGHPGEVEVTDADIDYLLKAADVALETGWTRADIRGAYAGLRVLRVGSASTDTHAPSSLSREWSLAEPMPGLFMPLGGKLTSARADAQVAVDRIESWLGRAPSGHPTEQARLPWAPAEPWQAWAKRRTEEAVGLGMDPDVAATAVRRYGRTFDAVLDLVRREPGLAARLGPQIPFCEADVIHGATHEMACTATDVLRRRLPLQLLAGHAPQALARARALLDGLEQTR